MNQLADELRAAGTDKIIFMVESEYENESSLLGLDGKPLYVDTTYNPHGLTRNHGTILQMPASFTPDIPVFQEGRQGRIVKQREIHIHVQVGDVIFFNYNAIGEGRKLAPGIYWINHKEIIAKEVPMYDMYWSENRVVPSGVGILPIGTHILLKPVFKDTVVEVDPEQQPGVMGEILPSGLISSTDQHLRGAGEIGAYKLVYEQKPDFVFDDEVNLPERLLVNDLYVRNQATVAHIGSNIKHRAPVAQVGQKVLVNLIDTKGMPNVPTIKIHGEEYFYLRQHEIEGVFID